VAKKKEKGKAQAAAAEPAEGASRLGPPPMIGPAQHPQAAALIRRAKGWGGMIGFALTALASWAHGSVPVTTCVRALAGGLVGYLIAWAGAVSIGRSLMKAQGQLAIERVLEARRRQVEETREAASKAAEAAAARFE
jgi:uncharacterized membrane protein YccC